MKDSLVYVMVGGIYVYYVEFGPILTVIMREKEEKTLENTGRKARKRALSNLVIPVLLMISEFQWFNNSKSIHSIPPQ